MRPPGSFLLSLSLVILAGVIFGCGGQDVQVTLHNQPSLVTVRNVYEVQKGDPIEINGLVPEAVQVTPVLSPADYGRGYVLRMDWKADRPPLAKSEKWEATWKVVGVATDSGQNLDQQQVAASSGGSYVSPLMAGGHIYEFSLAVDFSTDANDGRLIAGTVVLRRIRVDLSAVK